MRKRDGNFPDNGFEAWGGYMQAKISKLEDQFNSRALTNLSKLSTILEGVSIFVNGYTNPSANVLKSLMCQHGGVYHTYHRNEDYIIATNLPDTKVKKMDLSRVVRPDWIVESIAANQLLDYKKYLLYNSSRLQPKLLFNQKSSDNNSMFNDKDTKIINRTCTENNNKTTEKNECKPLLKFDTNDSSLNMNPNNLSDNNTTKTAANPNFISEFYNNSRLHHISQLGASFKQHVNELRENSKFVFPARNNIKQVDSKSNKIESNLRFDGGKTIMHIDMDCFFVSVGLRTRPELYGKPVAVTHSKGGQPRSKRPGVDRNVEFNLYKQKQIKKLSNATGLDQIELRQNIHTRVDNITDEDEKFGSMSEIASCSYEARAKGVTNGMFMGNALRLCPELETIPYDFDGYKEVAYTLYNTVAQYTLDIEAVSCDEMYVDCTELLESINLSAEDFAETLRGEIKVKTGCPCSTGFGGNRLQARLATKRAKPDGQFFLYSDLVKNYMFEIKLKDLPGVGRQITQKLETLGHSTCSSLQSMSLNNLKQHLGNKTGALLFEQCRGIDSHSLSYYNVRKSVSAEVNYGIRFENNNQCYDFIRQLAGEVSARMLQFKVIGKCVTLKLMIRAEEAPVETAKFMGHGFCNVINKSVTLSRSTNEADVIYGQVITIIKKLMVEPKEMRGVGIQVTKLESIGQKEIKGAMSKFLSAKPSNQTNESKKNLLMVKSNIIEDSKINAPEILPGTEKRPMFSPPKSVSPNCKNKSPTQRRRGRPPKSPRGSAASKNLLSKFIQGQSISCLKKEIIDHDTPPSSQATNTECLGFVGLESVTVRQLVRAWVGSARAPLPRDAGLMAAYLRHMLATRRLQPLRVLLAFLVRRTREMDSDSWKEVCDDIVQQVQNEMLAVYGKKLLIDDE